MMKKKKKKKESRASFIDQEGAIDDNDEQSTKESIRFTTHTYIYTLTHKVCTTSAHR